MSKIDQRLHDILSKFHDEPKKAVWNCHGTWVAYHKDLELIAAKAKILFDPPVVLEADGPSKCVALCVTARFEDRVEWSIGEAAPGNNKNAYPYAMAEKRAKDRVILKLLGLHGFIMSEEEADDFKAPPQKVENTELNFTSMENAIKNAPNLNKLQHIWKLNYPFIENWTKADLDKITKVKNQRKAVLFDIEAAANAR